jgi:hypothetical protein
MSKVIMVMLTTAHATSVPNYLSATPKGVRKVENKIQRVLLSETPVRRMGASGSESAIGMEVAAGGQIAEQVPWPPWQEDAMAPTEVAMEVALANKIVAYTTDDFLQGVAGVAGGSALAALSHTHSEVVGPVQRRNLTVLIFMINNPNIIAPKAGDPRAMTLSGVSDELVKRGHKVIRAPVEERFVTPMEQIARNPDVIVDWMPLKKGIGPGYYGDVPTLWYENGMTKGAVTIDPQGFLGDSFYLASLNDRVQNHPDEHLNDGLCQSRVREHLLRDTSKRPQSRTVDIPESVIAAKYIFVPTQKFDDLSVLKFSDISYPVMLKQVAQFCKEHDKTLVIKIHPALESDIPSAYLAQERFISELRKIHDKILQSKSSINFLMEHALFTITLNGGTLMDNFYTNTPVLAVARGFFEQTDALVYDTNVTNGMTRMLYNELPWTEKRKLRQRQVVCWYGHMSLSEDNTATENIDVMQRHINALQPNKQVIL